LTAAAAQAWRREGARPGQLGSVAALAMAAAAAQGWRPQQWPSTPGDHGSLLRDGGLHVAAAVPLRTRSGR
jgi:hypothetical protein